MSDGAPWAVTFLVNSLRVGGAEKHTIQLFNALDPARFRKSLIYLKPEEQLLDQVQADAGQVWCAGFGRGWDVRGLWRLRARLRDLAPRLLVCVNTYPLFYGHLARVCGGGHFAIVEIFHSTVLPVGEARKMRCVYRPLFNRSDRVVYVSQAQQHYWQARGLPGAGSTCIHNGIDTAHFQDVYDSPQKAALRQRFGFAASDFVVGICAALRPEKHHADLLEAIAQLKTRGRPAKCLIIGDGPTRAEVEARIDALGLRDDVAITGFQDDVRPCVAICDCMAIVSHLVETFSIAALEAMAMGKPLLMSDVGGAREQVEHGVHGFVFPAGDVRLIADALREMQSPGVVKRMGAAARQRVLANFHFSRMLCRYADVFAAVSSRRP